MSILRSGSEAVKKGFSAFERVIEVVDNVAHMGTEVTGAGVEIAGGWRKDIILTSEISRKERRVARRKRDNEIEEEEIPEEETPEAERRDR